jgi:endonuclease I
MKKLFTFFLFTLSLTVFAQAPTGYYSTAEGKNTTTLRTALQAIISNGATDIGYAGLLTAYAKTDENSSGKIWDMYSNCTFNFGTQQCGSYTAECDCYNREHTSPQSWFNSASPMVSDLFNVYPTDGKVNGERSNYPYGEVGTASYTSGNGSKLGASSFADYAGTVFEPVDQYKGDFARAYFYMATRYAGLCENWIAGANVMYSTAHLGLTTYAMNLFLKWSRQDPVSAKEILRNNAVYGIQNNRNPFVDNPGLEEYIWGNKTNATFSVTGTTTPYLASPTNGATIDFGKVGFQQTDTASVVIKGVNLTGDLTLTLTGTNTSAFSLPVTTISQTNATAGYKLLINFSALAMGLQTAQLTVTGGGITATPITLNATSADMFTATAASNITNHGFTANWSSSANATGYTLNVYSFAGNGSNAPKTLLEQDFLSGIPTGWTGSGYVGTTDLTSNLRLSSGSNFGKITTPALNLSTGVSVLTVKAKAWPNDAAAKLCALADADTLATWLTGADYQTYTVNIPLKTSTSTVSLYAFAGSGHRVYVDYVKIATQGEAQTAVSVSGYPKSVGNVLNYAVTNLQSDSAYYYKVTPEGNTTAASDQIAVRTLKSNTGIETDYAYKLVWTSNAEGIHFLNLPTDCNVSIVDMQGRQVQTFKHVSNELDFKLPGKGIYVLQVFENAGSKVLIQKFNSMY